ncbi:MAG: PIN domain-containing protein, partial [Actinobacteria bacterium]|nr:PIN domain-containing protein [Actinomycetota bacterium]
VAIANDRDPDHDAVRAVLEAHQGPLVTTPLVVTEAGWLIRSQLGIVAETVIYRSIVSGELGVETLTLDDWDRIAELVHTYKDIGLDAADASIIAIAERLNQTTIATLDERDFRIVRPAHTDAFELLPGPG